MTRKLLCLILFLDIVAISGCSLRHNIPSSPTDSAVNQNSQKALSSDLNAYLSSTTNVSSISLTHSPWGSNVLVLAQQPYFAASGRTCRELTITSTTGTISYTIVCQVDHGSWNTVRPVTRLLHH
ncbi:DVU3141 family protein [Oceanisphaera arctica]